jgi:hypothetical protein
MHSAKILRIGSEMTELIAGTRHSVAQSRLSMAEADTSFARPKRAKHCRWVQKSQSEMLVGDRI